MTGIPDEVVERVAKAICCSLDGRCECVSVDPEACNHVLDHARAALSASGWVEMREALTEYVRTFEQEFGEGKDEPDDSSVWAGMVEDGQFTFGHLRRARAALKAGDKT